MAADHPLVELAAVVADGEILDWAALESSADEQQRTVIGRLRTLAEIARIHETITAAGTASVSVVRASLELGSTWGHLQILDVIGSGRFGDVYRAFDPSLDREVALKILASLGDDADAPIAIVEEGRLAAQVRHANVVTIFGARRIGGQTGIWMELVRGGTLEAELAAKGPFTAEALVRVAVELGGALAAVHGAGLVHRDVKTTNVMRDADGRVVLGDFGTGRLRGADDQARSGLAGTPAYLAPEIFEGRPATPRSDIFSLGVLLYRLSTGRFPIRARSLQGYRAAHEAQRAAPVATLRPDLPRPLNAAIDRALSTDPDDRFETVAALVEAVRPRRRRWPAVAAAASVAIAILGAAWWTVHQSAVPFQARDWVLLTAFDNRTNDPGLDAAIVRALEAELRASTFANVVPRERVNDALLLMGRPTDARLDAALGRDVAARDGGIRALVTGEVRQSDEGYAVSAQILAPDGSAVARVHATAADFFGVIEQAALEIRRRLGETLPSADGRQTGLPRVSTTSVRALRQYDLAMQLFADLSAVGSQQDLRNAIEQLLRLAIAEDPEFAMAHLRLAISIGQQVRVRGRHDEATAYARRAIDLGGRLADVERLYIVASASLILGFSAVDAGTTAGHYREAEDAFNELLRQQPDHSGALAGLADLYLLWDRPADQLRMSLRIGEIRPNAFSWRARAARIAYGAGDLEQARRFARDAGAFLSSTDFERDPSQASWIKLFPAVDAWLQGDPATSLRLVDRVATEVPNAPASTLFQFVSHIAYMYLTLGRLEQAREVADRLADAPRNRAMRLQLAALAAAERGDTPSVRRLVAGRPVTELVELGSLLLTAGLVDEWRRVDAYLRTSQGRVRMNDHHIGLLALAEGRTADGVRSLRAVTARGDAPANRQALLQASVALAEIERASGDLPAAIATLEGASRGPRWQTATSWALGFRWIRTRAALAAVYRDAGRLSDAAAVEQELRQLVAVADADHPVRRQLDRIH